MNNMLYEFCIFDERGVLVFYEDFATSKPDEFIDRMNEERAFRNRM